MIQSVRKEYNNMYSFAELCKMAEEEKDFPSRVDVNDNRFFAPDSMIQEVQRYCQETKQPVPRTPGEIVTVVYQSLAKSYRETVIELEKITGKTYAAINIVGGGSNAAGTIYHYKGDERVNIVLAEAGGLGVETGETAASLNIGTVGILHGSKMYVMQTEDGQIIEPYSISAGLDYPGVGPMHCQMFKEGRSKVLPITDQEALDAAFELTKLEGIIPALESAHALALLPRMKDKFKNSEESKKVLLEFEEKLHAVNGRLLARPSGTENLIRLMMWGNDEAVITDLINELAAKLKEVL